MIITLEMYFLLFLTYSFFGWFMETFGELIKSKKFVNRGFLIGPYCPIYGFGAIMITILLKNYTNDIWILFFMSMIICGTLEYFTSYAMEKLFNARWWDYSTSKFNINGRICLETLIPFAIGGCLITYYLNPFFISIYSNIPANILNILVIALLIIFITDNIISFNIISTFKNTVTATIKDNTEEITTKVRNLLSKRSLLHRRLVNAFPDFKTVLKEKQKEFKEKADIIKDKLKNI